VSARRATHADIARIREIRAAVQENRLSHPERVSAADVAAFIERAEMWVWEEHGEICGFSAGDPADGSIWALFIDPAHEHRGIGQALLVLACDTVRNGGHATATLSTEAGSRAHRFYRLNGWTETGRNAKGEATFRKPI
jgi:GNAT superfamily N-acetyltransferase